MLVTPLDGYLCCQMHDHMN